MTAPLFEEHAHCNGDPEIWFRTFDAALRRYFGIGCDDADADEVLLEKHRDLPAEDAAMTFAADHDLDRIDWWSWG